MAEKLNPYYRDKSDDIDLQQITDDSIKERLYNKRVNAWWKYIPWQLVNPQWTWQDPENKSEIKNNKSMFETIWDNIKDFFNIWEKEVKAYSKDTSKNTSNTFDFNLLRNSEKFKSLDNLDKHKKHLDNLEKEYNNSDPNSEYWKDVRNRIRYYFDAIDDEYNNKV